MTWHIARKERRRVLHVDFQAKKKKAQLETSVAVRCTIVEKWRSLRFEKRTHDENRG